MQSVTEDRLIELFNAALVVAPAARAAWLSQACGDDAALRAELTALLPYAPSPTEGEDRWVKPLLAEIARQGAASSVQVGQTLGRYQIVAELGKGGMGKVYLAHDPSMARDVAIKTLPLAFTLDAQLVRRFEGEARAASALNHPNIMTVHEVGQHAGLPYFTCEHIDGVTLRTRMKQGRLEWPAVVAIALQVADALQVAHQANIVHRDIKPENIMSRADGLVKVLDFGIAKLLEVRSAECGMRNDEADSLGYSTASIPHSALRTPHSTTRSLLGTPNYMSPEQVRGETLDGRSDLFSFGLMLYEMLAGRHPLQDKELAEKLKTLADPLPFASLAEHCPAIPAQLIEAVNRAISKDKDQRFATAEAMRESLSQLKAQTADKPAADKTTQPKEANLTRLVRTQNANRLLNQFVVLAAAEPKTRLPFNAWWTIRRHSNLKRGKLEKRLMRKSLLSALRKGAAVACLAGLVTLGVIAWNSVEEKWGEQALRDGHGRAARRAVFSHDGNLLATYGADERIIIWDFFQRRQLAAFTVQAESKCALDFSPDGRWFAHSDGQAIIIREAKNPQQIVTVLRSQQSNIEAIGFSPDSKLLVSGVNSEKTTVWAVEGWRQQRELPGYVCRSKLLFYADSRRLLTHGGIWDMVSGRSTTTGRICLMAIAQDNRLAVSVEGNGNTILFDLLRGRQIKYERAHQFHGRAAAFSHDGRLAVTGAEDIALWDVPTQRVIARMEHTDNVWDLLFSPDDRWLVSSHGDGSILVWDMERRKRVADLAGHSDKVVSVAFSPSGNRIASASADQSVNLWNVKSGLKERAFADYPTALSRVSFWDEDTIIASDFENNFSWRSVVPQPEPPVPSLPNFVEGELIISPDRRWAIRDTTVYDWQAQRVIFDFTSTVGDKFGARVFSPDSRWLVFITRYDNRMFLCEAGTWRVVEQIKLSGLEPIRLAFTPDSQWLITGCINGEVAMWEVQPLQLKKVLGKHADHVQSIAVSLDGAQAVSASDDWSIAWWDLARGKLIYKHSQSAPILATAFSPDGRQVVAGGHDKSVRVYTRQRSLWGWRLD